MNIAPGSQWRHKKTAAHYIVPLAVDAEGDIIAINMHMAWLGPVADFLEEFAPL